MQQPGIIIIIMQRGTQQEIKQAKAESPCPLMQNCARKQGQLWADVHVWCSGATWYARLLLLSSEAIERPSEVGYAWLGCSLEVLRPALPTTVRHKC
jgi:hypothetical protein